MNRRVPNGTHGGVRGRKFLIKRNFLLLDYPFLRKEGNYMGKIRKIIGVIFNIHSPTAECDKLWKHAVTPKEIKEFIPCVKAERR